MTEGFLKKKLDFMSTAWWIEGLNYPLYEYSPRIYRPMSSFMQMLDFDFRHWLWQIVPPHPAVSFTWIFSLVLSPYFLYRLLGLLTVSRPVATFICGIYLSNAAFLSVVVMYFRPAKAMTNFSLIFALYLAALAAKDRSAFSKTILLYAFLVPSLLWDESAVVMFPALVILFPSLVLRDWRQRGAFVAALLAGAFLYTILLPKVTVWARYPAPNLMAYSPTKTAFDLFGLERILTLFHDYLYNLKIAVMDCAGLTVPWFPSSFWFSGLQYAQYLIVAFSLGFFALRCRLRFWREMWFRGLALFTLFVGLDTYALSTIGNNIWGLYYYGAYVGVSFIVLFAFFLQRIYESGRLGQVLVAVLSATVTVCSLYIFERTNFAYKFAHYYADGAIGPGPVLKKIFKNETNRFDFMEANALPRMGELTDQYWRCKREKVFCDAPNESELRYLLVELKIY
ncbi:MAG: hypothetical protein AB7F86_15020 [Bdellovibrionales bacterium]